MVDHSSDQPLLCSTGGSAGGEEGRGAGVGLALAAGIALAAKAASEKDR